MRRVVPILVAMVFLVAACNDDSSTSESTAPTATAEPTEEATATPTESVTQEPTEAPTDEPTPEATEPAVAEGSTGEEPLPFCADFIEASNQVSLADTGGGDPAALIAAIDAAVASAPDEVAPDIEIMAAFAQSGGQGDFAEFDAASARVLSWVGENCATTTIEAVGSEYEYEGFEETIEAGITAITLRNDGVEFHEAAVLRINDGVDLTAEEILALPEEEAQEMVTFRGAVFADPGASGTDVLDLSEPGNYIVACFIPVGATLEAAEIAEAGGPEPAGPPHFVQGMVAEFTVE